MLDRKRKTQDPCTGCALHKSLCICALIPSLDLRSKISLVVHHRELKRTTNTGTLALRILKNSAMYVRGLSDGKGRERLDLSCLLEAGYQPLLFYPSEDAVELTAQYISSFDRPVHLIVPDGNWRQASKVAIRHPELRNVPRVKISTPNLSTEHLRTEHMAEGMATLEAIAHALRVIEGEQVYASVYGVYRAKLKATLAARSGLAGKNHTA